SPAPPPADYFALLLQSLKSSHLERYFQARSQHSEGSQVAAGDGGRYRAPLSPHPYQLRRATVSTRLQMESSGASKMMRSIATVSIGGALDVKLRTIAAAGFDAVEIFEPDFTCFDGSARDVAGMCGDLGLAICALQPFRDFEGMPEPQRKQAFRRVEKKFDLMEELGTDLLLVCSNVSPASLSGIDRAADHFRELRVSATPRGFR